MLDERQIAVLVQRFYDFELEEENRQRLSSGVQFDEANRKAAVTYFERLGMDVKGALARNELERADAWVSDLLEREGITAELDPLARAKLQQGLLRASCDVAEAMRKRFEGDYRHEPRDALLASTVTTVPFAAALPPPPDEPKFTTDRLNDALKPNAAELTREPWKGVDSAEAFYGRAFRAPVKWGKFFEQGVSASPDLFNEAAVGFIYLPAGGASYVVSFGPAQNYLNDDAFVRSFGLKVVLNSVHESLLRGMDLNTPEELSKQRRVQTSRLTTADNFGVEIDRDILKQAVGAPTDKALGAQIAGADSLKVAPKILASQLGGFCTKLGTIAAKTDYRTKGFDWVDKIRPVKEKDIVDELDDILLKKLRAILKDEAPVEVHLAPPEIVEPASIDGYKFAGYGSRKGEFESLEMDNFRLDYLRNRSADELTLKEIRKTFRILVKPHGSSSFGGGWSFYRCLVTEVDRQGQVYVLSGGLWYEVEKDYAKLINGWFTSFLGSHPGIALMDAQKKETEPAYIDRVKLAHATWACLDTDEIKITGASHGVEPCDFLTDAGEFLHLKSEATSSKLSHLFNQGLVSAELFLMSQEFRTTLKDKVVSAGKAWPLGDPVNEPDRSTVRVNYAVMRRPLAGGTMTLPFFSKVSLRSVVNRLELLSVPVSFSWVRKVL